MDGYGNIHASDLEDCRQALEEPIQVDRLVDVYFHWVDDAIQFAQDRKTPFTLAQIVHTDYHAVNNTGLYSLLLKEWRKKVTADKTWVSFKQVFAEEYHDLVEETKVTSGDAVLKSANAIQEIGGAIKHLSMAAVDDKEIFTKLTEAVKELTRKNLYLTTQLRYTMKINLEIAKNINLKATQSQ